MPNHHLHPIPAAQTFRQLFRQIYRAVLPAGSTERYHQTLEAAPLISAHAGIHQRHDAREELMYAFLLIEIIDYRRVFACESSEVLFPSGIRDATGIENKSATMPRLIIGQPTVK